MPKNPRIEKPPRTAIRPHTLVIGVTRLPVTLFKQASDQYLAHQADLLKLDPEGMSEDGPLGPGLVLDAVGEAFAYVSNDGTVWQGKPTDKTAGQVTLYEPR